MNSLDDLNLLTLAEVAKLLHCSKAHVCNLIKGKVPYTPPLPAISLGRRRLVRRCSLEEWTRQNEHTSVFAL